ncbi:MAG: hypothetical protein AAB492_02630, partial [Patescibacteria group bacterium]
ICRAPLSRLLSSQKGGLTVIRAFSYAVGVEASQREYALRLKQYRASKRKMFIPEDALTIDSVRSASFQSILEEDDRAWVRLIKGIRRTRTPFGRALRDFDIDENQLTEKQIRTALKKGDRIVVYENHHVSCVGVGGLGILTHVSDRFAPPLCYDQGKPMRVFRLTKKENVF